MTEKISDYCRHEHCVPGLIGETKDEIVSELVTTFVESGVLDSARAPKLMAQILSREEEGTTGIGKGVAMPHARDCADIADTLIAVGIQADGVDWEATDGSPVHVVFLIVSANPEEYLSVAGKVARVARDDVEMKALCRQTTPKKMQKFLTQSWA